jgi:large subunit ribosomal protein L9
MKLILKQKVPNLGESGEIVEVKPGYGRNYLIPHGLAYVASDANLQRLEEEREREQEEARRQKLEAGRRAAQLAGATLSFFARASEEGTLFGSVTAADIAEKLNAEAGLDFEVSKKEVDLEEPIKTVGVVEVPIRFHADVEAPVEVRVNRIEG